MAKNRFDIFIKMGGATQILRDLGLTQNGMERLRESTKKLRRSIGAFRNNLLLISFTLGAVVRASEELVKAYRKQIEAEALLARGLKNVSGVSKDASKNLMALASSLQKVTTFGDEQIIMAQAQLATFQLTDDTIAHLTERMLDMSVGSQTDLISTAKMLGKAFTGQASALSRAGVVIDKTSLKQAQANGATAEALFLLEQLDNNYQGLARSLAQTPLGELDQLRLKLGDVNEELGKMSIPIQTWWTDFKLSLAETTVFTGVWLDEMKKIDPTVDAISVGIFQAFGRAQERLKKLKDDIKKAGDPATVTTDEQKKKNIQLEKEINILTGIEHIYKKTEAVRRSDLSLQVEQRKISAENQALLELERNNLIDKNELEKKSLEIKIKQLEIDGQLAEQQRALRIETIGNLSSVTSAWEENMKQRQDAELNRLKNTARFKNADSDQQKKMEAEALSRFKNEATARFRIEQGISLSNIYMKTAEAVGKSIALLPATIGSPLKEINFAAGMAQAALVLGQKPPAFALGGDFVTSGPQMIMVGDNPGGQERVQVTPLSSPPGPDAPSGNGLTLNISAPLVDETVIDSIIPAIERAQKMNLA